MSLKSSYHSTSAPQRLFAGAHWPEETGGDLRITELGITELGITELGITELGITELERTAADIDGPSGTQ